MLTNAPSQLAGCEAAMASRMSMNPMSFMVGLLVDFFWKLTDSTYKGP